jgi:hypothetical protein
MPEISNGCVYLGEGEGYNIRALEAAVLTQEMVNYVRGQRAQIDE